MKKKSSKSNILEHAHGFAIRKLKKYGRTMYQSDLGRKSGTHIRREFHTLAEARNFNRQAKLERDRVGIEALNFSEQQKDDATQALALLKDYNTNLRKAAKFYIKHHRKVTKNNDFSGLIERYLKLQKQRLATGDIRPDYFRDIKARLTPYSEYFSGQAIESIEATDLDAFMNELSFKGTNRKNYIRNLNAFYNWVIKQGLPIGNPIPSLEPVKTIKKTPEIYLPEQVSELFAEALSSHPKLIPFFSMAFWGGIRPEEIKRLTWADVDFENGEIHIKPEDSKTHSGRYVHISPNFNAWLHATPIGDGLIFPYSQSSLTRWRKEVHEATGIKAINDGARHTFATFHYALHGLDDTMQELGHTDSKMLFTHYRGLIKNRKTQAENFFAINPQSNTVIISETA